MSQKSRTQYPVLLSITIIEKNFRAARSRNGITKDKKRN